MGTGGAGPLGTIIAATIVFALECASLACGLLGVAGKFISRRLEIKSKKHNEIRVLAESKLNTISDYVSAALSDVSNQEFQLILSEIEKYNKTKGEIRTKTQKDCDAMILREKTKNSLLQRSRNETKANFIKSWIHNNINLSLRLRE